MDSSQRRLNDWQNLFLEHRPFLVSFAFRMTGSLADAEELAQDTFLECSKIDFSEVKEPKAWLTRVCSNKALDLLKSAYKQRETYPGTWLPDAVPESLQIWPTQEGATSSERNLLLSESLTTSFLLLLERLSPEERVTYLLSEVFEYSFKDIAQFLNKTEPACRKTTQRAREFLVANRKRFQPSPTNPTELISRFFDIAKTGDPKALSELLASDSEFWSDGGGKVSASAKVLTDAFSIAKFFAGVTPLMQSTEFKIEIHRVNSRPGVVISKKLPSGEWSFDTIMSFEFEGDQIVRIFAQRNPDKLSLFF